MSTDREAIAQTILTTPLTAEWQEAIRCRAAMEQPGEIITLMREWCAALVLGTEPRGPLPAITVYSGPTSAQPADPAACEHGQIAEHPMESEAELGVNPTLDCPGPSPAVLPETPETKDQQRQTDEEFRRERLNEWTPPDRCDYVDAARGQCIKWDDHIEGFGGDTTHRFAEPVSGVAGNPEGSTE